MSFDGNLRAIQAEIKVSATMLDAMFAFDRGDESLSWYCLFLWCEAKDEYATLQLVTRESKP